VARAVSASTLQTSKSVLAVLTNRRPRLVLREQLGRRLLPRSVGNRKGPVSIVFAQEGLAMTAASHANRFIPGIRTKTCGASQIANRNLDGVILGYRVPWAVV
jgi:hypothetical protein